MAYTQSEFNIAGNKVESSVSEAQKQDLNGIVAGDMNCNPSESNCSRTEILSCCPQMNYFLAIYFSLHIKPKHKHIFLKMLRKTPVLYTQVSNK